MSSAQRQRIHVLVLDGGGVRGLSSLLILREIMRRMQFRNGATVVRPSDWFDLIVGTGTGGISARLIGRMRMTVDDAITEYMSLAKTAFTPSSTSLSRILTGQAILYGSALDRGIGDIASRYLRDRDAPLDNSSTHLGISHCRTAVLATSKASADGPPHIFRSYGTAQPPSQFTVREVARATAATAPIFPPAKLGNPPVEYIDAGSAGFNNPAKIALDEVSELWPGRKVDCLVSLGTGCQKVVNVQGSSVEIAGVYNAILRNCEQVHDEMMRRQEHETWPYFRFNVDRGLEDVGMYEWDPATLQRVTGITEGYMRWLRVTHNLGSCVHVLNGDSPGELSSWTRLRRLDSRRI